MTLEEELDNIKHAQIQDEKIFKEVKTKQVKSAKQIHDKLLKKRQHLPSDNLFSSDAGEDHHQTEVVNKRRVKK
jgi:hypothetical protein